MLRGGTREAIGRLATGYIYSARWQHLIASTPAAVFLQLSLQRLVAPLELRHAIRSLICLSVQVGVRACAMICMVAH
eukprot:1014800-Pleurochrysis_carterae.AAC.1